MSLTDAARLRRTQAVGADHHIRYVPRSAAEDRAVADLLDEIDAMKRRGPHGVVAVERSAAALAGIIERSAS